MAIIFIQSLAIFCNLLLQTAIAIPVSEFYEFGTSADRQLGRSDDAVVGPIQLRDIFTFYGTNHTSLYINNNGDISFGRSFSSFSIQSFPLRNDDVPLIAPFWADVDTRSRGTVHYREVDTSTKTETVMRVESEIMGLCSDHVDFRPNFVFVVTWVGVGFFGGSSSPLINTFQCVLTSNGQRSFVFFLYADRLIQWPDQSNMVVAGFNAGDRDRAYSIPIALINGRPDLDTTSNVDMPGVWVFQVSGPEVVSEPIPTCADNINDTTPSDSDFGSGGSGIGATDQGGVTDTSTLKLNGAPSMMYHTSCLAWLFASIFLVFLAA